MKRGKFTPKAKEAILEAIRNGNTHETAARLAGITAQTFYNWLAKGRDQEKGVYRTFLDEVEQAEAEAMAFMVDKVKQAAYEDWRAAGWYLERRRPQEWGRRDRLAVDNQHSGSIKTEHEEIQRVEITHMLENDPELQKLYMQVWERQQLASRQE